MLPARFNIHPGEILREEFLKPAGMSPDKLARDLKLSSGRVEDIVEERASVCVDVALRLAHYFGTTERFWLELQLAFDLERARKARPRILAEISSSLIPA